MKCINVITLRQGLLEDVNSYIVMNKVDEARQVVKAEEDFCQQARDHGAKEKDLDKYVEDGSYDSMSGFEVLLTLSNVYL